MEFKGFEICCRGDITTLEKEYKNTPDNFANATEEVKALYEKHPDHIISLTVYRHFIHISMHI